MRSARDSASSSEQDTDVGCFYNTLISIFYTKLDKKGISLKTLVRKRFTILSDVWFVLYLFITEKYWAQRSVEKTSVRAKQNYTQF